VAIIVAVLGLLSIGGLGGVFLQRSLQGTNTASSVSDGNSAVTQEESTIATIAEKVSPSVVSVVTETHMRSYYGTTTAEGAGTGIIVSKDGYVMTSNHVIEAATSVAIIDSTGKQYDNVTVIGRDPLNDIAFLKIASETEFTPAVIGNSSTIRIGQQVVAIGNALGQYSNTVTSGIISGVGRPVTASTSDGTTESLTDLIQTDASINEGNSGGPLVNTAGQVIGINTAIAKDANGIGFSIPINSTKGVLAGVLSTGKISRAYLGLNYLTITSEVVQQYNLTVNKGAYISSENSSAVASSGPAAKSGIKQGDIITKVNDDTLGIAGGLSSVIGQYKPGDTVTLTYLRDGKEQTAQVTLGTYGQ
jgi:serine protease Do